MNNYKQEVIDEEEAAQAADIALIRNALPGFVSIWTTDTGEIIFSSKDRKEFIFGGIDYFNFRDHIPEKLSNGLSEFLSKARDGDWQRFSVPGGNERRGTSRLVTCRGTREEQLARKRRRVEDIIRKSPDALARVLQFCEEEGIII